MQAKIGFILSLIATVANTIIYLVLIFDPLSLPVGLLAALIVLLLFPLVTIVFVMLVVSVVLIGTGRTKVGGVLMIVFSCISVFFAIESFFIPLGLGIAGGILARKNR